MSVLWQKNGEQPADWFMTFTAGKDRHFDKRLVFEDLLTNLAQVVHLFQTGIVSGEEAELLLAALRGLWREAGEGTFTVAEADEDVHSAVEKKLEERIGKPAGKIHTGRSRNDQVMNDLRLYVLKESSEILSDLAVLTEKMIDFSVKYNAKVIPGFTHTRPAMPSSADAWMEGWLDALFVQIESLQLDFSRFDRLPLGSAAGYGVPEIPVNRPLLAQLLGFSSVQNPVTAVQLSRGMDELALIDTLGYIGVLFGRMATDVIAFSDEDGAFSLSAEQTSGSSIMPQKKNPDVWELIRAAASDFQGFRSRLLLLQTNQRSGYHRDFQTVKEILMEAIDHFKQLIPVVGFAVDGISVRDVENRLHSSLLATQAANHLVVENGMPFREAYRNIGANPESFSSLTFSGFSVYRHSGAPGHFIADIWRGKAQELSASADVLRMRRTETEQRLLEGTAESILSQIPSKAGLTIRTN